MLAGKAGVALKAVQALKIAGAVLSGILLILNIVEQATVVNNLKDSASKMKDGLIQYYQDLYDAILTISLNRSI